MFRTLVRYFSIDDGGWKTAVNKVNRKYNVHSFAAKAQRNPIVLS